MSWLRSDGLFRSRWFISSLAVLGSGAAFTGGTMVSGRGVRPSVEDVSIVPALVRQRQSPVALQSTIAADLAPLQIAYRAMPLAVYHNGYTLQVKYPEGSALTLDGESYALEDIYFQSPSEHTVYDTPYAMEVQFVHRQDDHVVIVGVFVEVGEAHPEVQKIWDHIPPKRGPKTVRGPLKTFNDVIINAANLLPQDLDGYYRYSGSLTDPPYDENVTWIVLQEPITISAAQLEQFVDLIGPTARPVQPQLHRLILEVS